MTSRMAIGWSESTLGDVTTVVGGGTPDTSDEGNFCLPPIGIPWLSPVDLSGYTSKFISHGKKNLTEKGFNSSSAKLLPKGSVLFSSRAPIGYVAIAQNPLTTNQGFRSLIPSSAINSSFLYYYLKNSKDKAEKLASGSTFLEISGTSLKQITIRIPPLAEQHRIVAKLDSILPSVEKVRERLEKIPALVKRFRQSVLDAACYGRLTEGWRAANRVQAEDELIKKLIEEHIKVGTDKRKNAADPDDTAHDLDSSDLPESWRVVELKWLCHPDRPITYGILKPGLEFPKGVPYVRVADFPGDRLSLTNIKHTSPEIASQYRRSILSKGDILLSIRGTYGRVCRVPEELEGANITQDTARLSIHLKLNADYIATFLRSPAVQKRIVRAAKGVAVRGINIGDVRALQIAVPPSSEQTEIVRQVDKLFALADKLEAHYHRAMARVEKFPQAILAKAFRGELVPQDPNDEPAEKLLERIRQERAGLESGGRAKKKPSVTPKRAKAKAMA